MKVNESKFLEERQAKIYQLVNEYRRITVQELSKYFKISAVTIRNDLTALEQAGKIIRTHGGAIAVDESVGEASFDVKISKNSDLKRIIGKKAAETVQDGEVIFIDGGTTCSCMYPFLIPRSDLTIITPSIETAYWLTKTSTINIQILGGRIRRETFSTITTDPDVQFTDWNISKAFISAYSFTPEDGIMDVYPIENDTRVPIIKKARQITALIDSSKWGNISMTTVLSTPEIHTIITDEGAPEEMRKQITQSGVQLIVV